MSLKHLIVVIFSSTLFFSAAYADGNFFIRDFQSFSEVENVDALDKKTETRRNKLNFLSQIIDSKKRYSDFNHQKIGKSRGPMGKQEKSNHSTIFETRQNLCHIEPDQNGHVNIPEGVDTIASGNAWTDCLQLRSVTFPASLVTITDSAFSGTSLESVHFPANVVEIGYFAFSGVSTLTSITFAASSRLTYISDGAFQGTSLNTVSLPPLLVYIGNAAFQGTALTAVSLPPSLLSVGPDAFPTGVTVTVNRPHCTYEDSLYSCCMIEPDSEGRVDIPEGTTYVPYGAFIGCSRLHSVSIPRTVSVIGGYSFLDSSLSSVAFSTEGVLTKIDVSAFHGTKLVNVVIPRSVKYIKESAFGGISTLTSVIFAEDGALTLIDLYAFEMAKLTSVTIPRKVSVIGEGAFIDVDTLTSVTFAADGDLKKIDWVAFSGTALTAVSLPSSLEIIGGGAFPYGTTLTGLKPYCSYDGNSLSCCVIQPDGEGHVTIPEGAMKVLPYSFTSCSGLVSVSIPSSVSAIGEGAFFGLGSLTSVTFAADGVLTKIDRVAFSGTGLAAVSLPSSLESIGDMAFPYGTTLTGLKPYCSYDGNSLSCCMIQPDGEGHVTIPQGTMNVPPYSFAFCSGLVSVSIPSSVSAIGEGAFSHDFRLTSVTFSADSDLTEIGPYAFDSANSLIAISLPSSLESIDDKAFTYSPMTFTCLNPKCTYDDTNYCRICDGDGSGGGGGGSECPSNSYPAPGTGNCVCIRGFIPSLQSPSQCSLCPYGQSTVHDGSSECVSMQGITVVSEKRCFGYKSMHNVLPSGSISVKYMPTSEEKSLVFTGITKAFFDTVSTVEARFIFSYPKENVGGNSFPGLLSKKDDIVMQRHLLPVPPYSGKTYFHLSFPSCVEHLLKPGQYISKLRLKFFSVQPEAMLTTDKVVGCMDYRLDPDSAFSVNAGVCTVNPHQFSLDQK